MTAMTLKAAADAGTIVPGTNAFGNYRVALRVAAELGNDYEVRGMAATHRSGGCWSADRWAVVVNRNVPEQA